MIKKLSKEVVESHKFRHIHKVGMELEGGWVGEHPTFTISGDSSVACEGDTLGEYRTIPSDSLKGALAELGEKYPHDIDESCGFHIHISTSPSNMAILADRGFYRCFYNRMFLLSDFIKKSKNKKDYDRLCNRLDGKNAYCKSIFNPIEQLSGGDRRTSLNFCSYQSHKTLENRLFPMFELKSNAAVALKEYIDCVEDYIEDKKSSIINPISIIIK